MVRIALADDHEIVRAGLKMILESIPQVEVVGEAAEGSSAYALVARERPDLLLLDISMPPGQSGLVACGDIARDFPGTKILVVTMYAEPEYLRYTLNGGAAGYVLKSASPAELTDAIQCVLAGKRYVHPKLAKMLRSADLSTLDAEGGSLQSLTTRELEILQLIAKGFTNREISEQIFLSVKTVEAHRARIFSKLELKSRAELVDYAIQHKLLGI